MLQEATLLFFLSLKNKRKVLKMERVDSIFDAGNDSKFVFLLLNTKCFIKSTLAEFNWQNSTVSKTERGAFTVFLYSSGESSIAFIELSTLSRQDRLSRGSCRYKKAKLWSRKSLLRQENKSCHESNLSSETYSIPSNI